jgi:hypothetical protein
MSEQKTLLDELGLTDLPIEERDMLIAELGEIIFSGVMERSWNDLALDKQDRLTSLLRTLEEKPDDASREASLVQFLETQVPEFKNHLLKEVELFKKKYNETLGELE